MPAGRPVAPSVSKKSAWPVRSVRTGLRSRYQTERGLSGLSMSNTMRRRASGVMRTALRKRCEVCERSPVLSTRVPCKVCAWYWSLMKNRLKRASVEVTVALFHSVSSAAPSGRLKSSKWVRLVRSASTRLPSPPSKRSRRGWLTTRPSASMRSIRTVYGAPLTSGCSCTRRFAVTSQRAWPAGDARSVAGARQPMAGSWASTRGGTSAPPRVAASSGHQVTRNPAASSPLPSIVHHWPQAFSPS